MQKSPRLLPRLLPFLLSVPLLFFLAACSSTAPKQVEQRVEPTNEAAKISSKPVRKPASPPLKHGGGFYKDDGPAEDIPDNLDDIPDASPGIEALHRFANRPYVVLGKSYVPNTSLKTYKARGIASWYGKKFHGQKTSIGEPYDMFSMTAAHPTLAIPSYVRVSHAASGKSVVVRVTDRGPFHADRIIDLSYAAAYKLGLINNGSGLVEVEAIVPDDATSLSYAQLRPPVPAPMSARILPQRNEPDDIERLAQKLATEGSASSSAADPAAITAPATLQRGVFLQLGAFSSADNADSLRAHLSRELDWLTEGIQINAGGGMHRVHLGPYANRAEAERTSERIRAALGYRPTVVTR